MYKGENKILERHPWIEYHTNGAVWITGEIGVVSECSKHLYAYLTEVKGFEGRPVCRLGKWTKHYDNGQLAWTIDYGDGTHDYKRTEKFLSYRKDGSPSMHSSNY